MATFVALNVEPEEDSEDEIDDTKEIQIEEALKLYQTALKLHSQGPAYYDEAEAAYNILFQSEVFTYPESLSESKQDELYSDTQLDIDDVDNLLLVPSEAPVASADGLPNTLPQILYLSYKNHGQFLLDRLKCFLLHAQHEMGLNHTQPSQDSYMVLSTSATSLNLFVEALERDDTDSDLWRRASRIGGFLGSKRIARFCLEAVLDTDGDESSAWVEPLGLEEICAKEELRALLQVLRDSLSESQLSNMKETPKHISSSLKRVMDTCPYLPLLSQDLGKDSNQMSYEVQSSKHEIQVPLRTWASCGKAILHQFSIESQGLMDPAPGASYSIRIPTNHLLAAEVSQATQSMLGPMTLPTKVFDNGTQPMHVSSTQQLIEDTIVPKSDNLLERVPVPTYTDVSEEGQRGEVLESPIQGTEVVAGQLTSQTPGHVRNPSVSHPSSLVSGAKTEATRRSYSFGPANTVGTVSLPTRKRSSESAGLQELVDSERSNNKRMRTRGSLIEPSHTKESTAKGLTPQYEDLLRTHIQADQWMFDVAGGFFSKLGADYLGSLVDLKQAMFRAQPEDGTGEANSSAGVLYDAIRDLCNVLAMWDFEKSNAFLIGDGLDTQTPDTTRGNSGLTIFLEHSKRGIQKASSRPTLPGADGLDAFAYEINEGWVHLDELGFRWIKELLSQSPTNTAPSMSTSTYESFVWPDVLKETIVQLLIKQDDFIYEELRSQVTALDNQLLVLSSHNSLESNQNLNENPVEFIQNIFELHLDIYGRITNPSSEVDVSTRTLQRDRLGRWATLASDAMSKRPTQVLQNTDTDRLSIRYLWSSVVYTSLIDVTSRDHIIICLQDMKRILEVAGNPIIELQNNAIMPEISIEAAEREISRLTTMDFFLNIFDTENSDPLAVIESLEPLLERSTQGFSWSEEENHGLRPSDSLAPQMQQMLQFLDRASLPLQLFLWRRLWDAYGFISYPPKVFSCQLRSIELIMSHLCTPAFVDSTREDHHVNFLYWLRALHDLITRALVLALNDPACFDCMDDEHLRTSMGALAKLQRLLYTFTLWEDAVHVGQVQAPAQLSGSRIVTAYTVSMTKFREMQIALWSLQYTLLREAMAQNFELFPTPNEDLADYLKVVHHAFGMRQYCQLSNKSFLRLMKAELLRLNASENWELDMAQIMFDLHGLKICPNFAGLLDHACPPEALDRRGAIDVMDLVMVQVNRMSMKDLTKSELKSTVEKLQQAIGPPKQAEARTFNKRVFLAYLRSPINPIAMYRSLQGIGDLCGASVNNEDAIIASKGWYFLLGHIALTKFRSQKRNSQGPTDELDIATTFFRQDLEFGTDKWETWYRLAQVHDSRIEEEATWNADKINNNPAELQLQQRHAINCYTMAVASANRCADASFETVGKISDLYADFGMRVYASSREPFSMAVFNLDEFTRHFSSLTMGMYTRRPFRDLQLYSAWKYASVLFRQALVDKPHNWMNWYMLAKCLWKMHNCNDALRGNASQVNYQQVLDALIRAIQALPGRRDNRHPEKDPPILEPHYKLISIVHKLVQSKRVQPDEGCQFLEATPYARKIPAIHDAEDWEHYILHVLKALRSADKANWHHRMVARAAHVIYDDSSNDIMAALGAKHELTQQIFTKTMSIQVWKPEYERAGRHFVYTGRYVTFFVRLLAQLNDRPNLEALAKRIRKRSVDFVQHSVIWQEVCVAYSKLLRRYCAVSEGHEDTVFKSIPHDDFVVNAERMMNCAQSLIQTPIGNLLREAVELKKLNAGLMKSSLIDDLIGDAYATLYERVVPDLITKSNNEENRDRMRVDHLLMSLDGPHVDTPPSDSITRGAESAVAKPRNKPVGRKEIQRKAEALVTKLAAPPVLLKAPRALGTVPQQENALGEPILAKEDAVTPVGGSVPGSLHDSADDESELSDIEEIAEMAERRPLFPNLVESKAGTHEESRQGSEQEVQRDEVGDREGSEAKGDEAEDLKFN